MVGALALTVMSALPSDAGEPPAPNDSGAFYGVALAAAELCPGGVLTEQAKELPGKVDANARAAFQELADKTLAGWRSLFACREADPENGRPNTGCRRAKLMSCRQAWIDLGPEGTQMRGMIDFKMDAPRDAQR